MTVTPSPQGGRLAYAVILNTLWMVACGDETTAEPASTSNRAPAPSGEIPAQTTTVDVAKYFTDPDGDALVYTAASSNVTAAAVFMAGSVATVSTVAPGVATITVTARDPGGLSAQLTFIMAVSDQKPLISSVEPVVLVEGREAKIVGSGFSPTIWKNRVSIGGRDARVTAATRTFLIVEVPWANCRPPRREELRVTVGGWSDARSVGVTPRTREDLNLELGYYIWTYAGNGCVHLPGDTADRHYLIGVVSSSEDPASLTGVTLSGTSGDATVVGVEGSSLRIVAAERASAGLMGTIDEGPVTALSEDPFGSGASFGQGLSQSRMVARNTLTSHWVKAHSEIVERNQALLRELERVTRQPAVADVQPDLQIGDVLTLYADGSRTCVSAKRVQAVVRWVGSSSIWLDDLDNPARSFTDTELADLDAFYSANIKDVHDEYFGGLSDVDDNRRFLVLMTKEVNRRENVTGWVSPLDLVSSNLCSTSNQAEIFYGKVPDPMGSVGDVVTKKELLYHYPSLIAHELTHMIQYDALLNGGAAEWGRKADWEIEGGATLAEQLVGYRLFGHNSGQELGMGALYPTYGMGALFYPSLQEREFWYGKWLYGMGFFLGSNLVAPNIGLEDTENPWHFDARTIPGAPEECSWVGGSHEGNSGPCLLGGRVAVDGVSSMVLRYAMDRWGEDYPGGERALLRRFTRSSMQGFASLVDVSPEKSWRPEQILSDFYITLWGDLQGWKMHGMTTWDLHAIFTTYFTFRLQRPHTSSAPRPSLTAKVRAGSSLYFHWTPAGPLNPTSIKVELTDGGQLPDHISLWVLRIR